jgi:hypothetical protein
VSFNDANGEHLFSIASEKSMLARAPLTLKRSWRQQRRTAWDKTVLLRVRYHVFDGSIEPDRHFTTLSIRQLKAVNCFPQ